MNPSDNATLNSSGVCTRDQGTPGSQDRSETSPPSCKPLEKDSKGKPKPLTSLNVGDYVNCQFRDGRHRVKIIDRKKLPFGRDIFNYQVQFTEDNERADESVKFEQFDLNPVETGAVKFEQFDLNPVETEPVKFEQFDLNPVETEAVKFEQFDLNPVETEGEEKVTDTRRYLKKRKIEETGTAVKKERKEPCVACKYHRKKCEPNCVFAQHFSEDRAVFEMVNALFGSSNIRKRLENLALNNRQTAMNCFIKQAKGWNEDPIEGGLGNLVAKDKQISDLKKDIETLTATVSSLRKRLM